MKSTSTDPGKRLDWEPYSVPHLAKDPVYVPDVELPNEDIMSLLEHPAKMGVVRVFLDPVAHELDWLDTSVVGLQGVATGTGPFGSYKIEGARWHLLRQVVAPQLQGKFVPFLLPKFRRWWKKMKTIFHITGRFFEQHKVYLGRRRCWERLCLQPLLSFNAWQTQKQSIGDRGRDQPCTIWTIGERRTGVNSRQSWWRNGLDNCASLKNPGSPNRLNRNKRPIRNGQ